MPCCRDIITYGQYNKSLPTCVLQANSLTSMRMPEPYTRKTTTITQSILRQAKMNLSDLVYALPDVCVRTPKRRGKTCRCSLHFLPFFIIRRGATTRHGRRLECDGGTSIVRRRRRPRIFGIKILLPMVVFD